MTAQERLLVEELEERVLRLESKLKKLVKTLTELGVLEEDLS